MVELRFEQAPAHRLQAEHEGAVAIGLLEQRVVVTAADDDDRHVAMLRFGLDAGNKAEAVELGHVEVDEGGVVGVFGELQPRFLAVPRRVDGEIGARELADGELALQGVVVDDEDPVVSGDGRASGGARRNVDDFGCHCTNVTCPLWGPTPLGRGMSVDA